MFRSFLGQNDQISDESGPEMLDSIESESSEQEEYERKRPKEGDILPGDIAINCKKYIHHCFVKEFMDTMDSYCKGLKTFLDSNVLFNYFRYLWSIGHFKC